MAPFFAFSEIESPVKHIAEHGMFVSILVRLPYHFCCFYVCNFPWTIQVVLFAHFSLGFPNLFPSPAENNKMIEIESTSSFSNNFQSNRSVASPVPPICPCLFVPLVPRSFGPYCHLAIPASTRSRSRNCSAPLITPFWISFLWTHVYFFFFYFQKRFSRLNDCDELLFKSSWEKTKSARWRVKRTWYSNSPCCFCVLSAHFAASLASAGVKWNLIPPTGRNWSLLRSTKVKKNVTFSVWSFSTIVVGFAFLLLFEMKNNN